MIVNNNTSNLQTKNLFVTLTINNSFTFTTSPFYSKENSSTTNNTYLQFNDFKSQNSKVITTTNFYHGSESLKITMPLNLKKNISGMYDILNLIF